MLLLMLIEDDKLCILASFHEQMLEAIICTTSTFTTYTTSCNKHISPISPEYPCTNSIIQNRPAISHVSNYCQATRTYVLPLSLIISHLN